MNGKPAFQLASPRSRPGRNSLEQGQLLAEIGLLFGSFGIIVGLANRGSDAAQGAVATAAPFTHDPYTPPPVSCPCAVCSL